MKPKFSDHDHYEAYIKSPRLVIQKKTGKYIHETLHRASEFPRGTEFRTVKINGHRLVVGYWGRKIRGKHEFFAVNSVLHPKEKNCRFKRRLAQMGVKLTPGKAVRLNGVTRLTGQKKVLIIGPMRLFI